ncbi:MAG: hypothetical protein BMS9Abin26_0887 [Gammaproteobacteria bacterium]|nr:MAG: hypothetical protein BMS9Abin26_0887 [Gammaproteobacteria bacterium]
MNEVNAEDVPLQGDHLIEIRKENFGYCIVHIFNGKLLFTGTYQSISEAQRVADRLIHTQKVDGNEVSVRKFLY